ncbi:MAG: hypothetical protein JOZ02_22360 [Acidobacteria bacterium]|nr:hypothetical protein [Acidobacteriota bacterium]
MKALGSLTLMVLLAGAAVAQEAAATPPPHGVSVLKTRWEKRVNGPLPVFDAMNGVSDRAQLERERKDAIITNRALDQLGLSPVAPPTEPRNGKKDAPPVERSDNQTYYLYEAKVSNNGAKKIRLLVWDYILSEPKTQGEVGHHQFETKINIGVGQTRSLLAWSTLPPASTVNVAQSDKQVRGQYTERVEIQRVVYEDGTVWEREPKQ